MPHFYVKVQELELVLREGTARVQAASYEEAVEKVRLDPDAFDEPDYSDNATEYFISMDDLDDDSDLKHQIAPFMKTVVRPEQDPSIYPVMIYHREKQFLVTSYDHTQFKKAAEFLGISFHVLEDVINNTEHTKKNGYMTVHNFKGEPK